MSLLLLDLFCGAGGAARGYHDAGFTVIGVDINPQPRYPYQFVQADALQFIEDLRTLEWEMRFLAAIHASPPCQHYSAMSRCRPGLTAKYPDLIEPAREQLIKSGRPYVIENVEGAPLVNPVTLCGSHFNLESEMPGIGRVGLQRHRLFETSFPVPDPGPHDHFLPPVQVTGHGASEHHRAHGKGEARASREVMGISWMRRDELCESVPPAYTAYIGQYLMEHLNG